MKKVISVLLTLALVVGLVSVSAVVSADTLSEIRFQVELPAIGDLATGDLSVVTALGEGYEVTKIEWTNPEGFLVSEDEEFQKDQEYVCVLQVIPTGENLFPESRGDLTGYINGEAAKISPVYNTAYACLKLTFTPSPAIINEVSAQVKLPLIGDLAVEDLSVVTDLSKGFDVVDIDWTDLEGGIIPADKAFEADKPYLCILKLEPIGENRFIENREDFAGYINGKEAQISINHSADGTYLELEFYAAPALLNEVQVEVDLPAVGDLAVEDLSAVTPLCPGFEVVDIDWADPEGIIIPEEMAFEAGKPYLCILEIKTIGDTLLPENREDFAGYINGKKTTISQNYATTYTYLELPFFATAYGDADENGKVDAADALKALQHAVKLITLEGNPYTAANVNGDDKIDATDALLMLQYTVKLIDMFPVEA